MRIKDSLKKNPVLISVISAFVLIFLIIAAIFLRLTIFSGTSDNGSKATRIDFHKVDIVPLVSDKTGVNVNSGFKITSTQDCSESDLKSTLTIFPLQNYKLKKVSSKEYNLNFVSALKPNSIYKISLGNKSINARSWAFQTKKVFRIERTLPRDTGTDVPLNSGIEITFSQENMDNLDNYFEISPKVEGRFEYHKKTAVFVPKGLKENTIYTVTLKKGIGLKNSTDKIQEDYTFKFQTIVIQPNNNYEEKYFNLVGEHINNFTSSSIPIFEVYAGEYFKGKEFNVEVFKFPDEKGFIEDLKKYDTLPYWAHTSSDSKMFDSSKLTSISTFKTVLYNKNNTYWNTSFISLPDKLAEGHYLVTITFEKTVCQALLQINDDACYLMVGENKSLAWVNDSASGQPVENASVEIDGLKPVKTDKEGIAQITSKIPDPKTGSNYYFTVSRDNRPAFVAPLAFYPNPNDNEKAECKYWSYMYLDRGLYLPNDTVKLWGLLKPRKGSDTPSKATLELYPSNYYGSTENDTQLNMISSKEIDFSSLGTYKSEMELSNLNPGTYYLQLKINDNVVSSEYFDVRQYTKPAYKLTVNSDKEGMYSWDTANIAVQANFFEGSPVSGLNLDYNYDPGIAYKGTLKCDQNGSAHFTLQPDPHTDTWHPYYLDINVGNSQAEEEEITASKGVTIFPSDLMIEINSDQKDSKGLVDVQTHSVDFTKNVALDSGLSPDTFRGKNIDSNLHAKIYEDYWLATENGDYYDIINKTVQKLYSYTHVEKVIKEFDFKTTDGKYSFDFDTEKGKYYQIEITGTDSHKNNISEKTYLGGYSEYDPNNSDSNIKYYSIENQSGKDKFKVGDKVSLDMKCNDTAVPECPKAKSLYLCMKNGLLDYKVVDNTKYSFDFEATYVPNIFVQGVYFDGTDIFNANFKEIDYDYNEKKLDINVQPDKKDYKPGDTVNLAVNVKDPTGKPCSAEVDLSVVDEAFFAIQDQSVDTLASLYQSSFYSGIISDFVSYKQIDLNGMSTTEMGGEGEDEGVRYMFKDNGFFGTVKTGKDGKGSVSFKLPDNLTSWRITYQGVTDNLLAGSGTTNINSKLPFFIDVILSNVFMDGDSPFITTRSFGAALGSSDRVNYTVALTGQNGYKKTIQETGTGNSYTCTDLGKLKEGSYSVTISATSGKYKDAIKKDFKVVKNILEAARSNQYKLTEGLKPGGGASLTTLTFYNKSSSLYLKSLWELMCQWGNRVDQKLSRKEALNLTKKYYPEEYSWFDSSEDTNIQNYQCPDGGIALLSYDSSDPVLSAKICSIAKDSLDQSALKQYFYSIINNSKSSPENVAASYWGLASLNEPVLVEIRDILGSPGIGTKEKIYLGIALAEIGDSAGSEDVYTKITSSDLKRVDPYIYLNIGKDRDDISDSTSLLSILALKINAPEKNGLFMYTIQNSTKDILVNLEKLIFIKDSLPDASMTGKFTLSLDGSKKEVTLNKSESYQVTLTSDKLKKISFSNISGDIEVSSSFTGPIKDMLKSGNAIIKLERTYTSENKQTNVFNQSDLIKIVLHPQFSEAAPDGFYEITDVLPSGLRFVPKKQVYGQNWYFDEINAQKISFWYYYQKNSKDPKQDVEYFARAVSPGEFTADNAIIKDTGSNASGFADQKHIKVVK